MITREEAVSYALSFHDVYQDEPFHDDNWTLMRVSGSQKSFLCVYEHDGYLCLNVKMKPDFALFWRSTYRSVTPGYHMNKEHWSTIIVDGTVAKDDIFTMISHSYEIVAKCPSKAIYDAVKRIPCGCVATYGRIAELAGDKKMARAVGNALHKNPDPLSIPCHRVVNAKGELAGGFAFGGSEVQAELLRAEGVEVNAGKVDLERYGW